MITEGLLSVLFGFSKFVIALIPDFVFSAVESSSGLKSALSYLYTFVPQDTVMLCLGHIFIYLSVGIGWAFVEFILKKIPFLGME